MRNINCLIFKKTNESFKWEKGVLEERDILKGIQNYVKGNVESASFLFPNLCKKNIVVYVNEDGKLMNLPTTLVCKTNNKFEEIKGNLCFVKLNSNGHLISIKKSDIKEIRKTINYIKDAI